MYTLMNCSGGVLLEGIIVSRTDNRMRVAASGAPDIVELTRQNSVWLTDRGEQVEFVFVSVVPDGATEVPRRHTVPWFFFFYC